MLTHAQATAHAHKCGMHSGEAVPLPVGLENVSKWYRIAYDVVHPETLDVILPMGHYATGYMLDALAECYGIDYVVSTH